MENALQTVGILLVATGLALFLLMLGVRPRIGNVDIAWLDKPRSSRIVLPVALLLFGAGLWLIVQPGEDDIVDSEVTGSSPPPPAPSDGNEAIPRRSDGDEIGAPRDTRPQPGDARDSSADQGRRQGAKAPAAEPAAAPGGSGEVTSIQVGPGGVGINGDVSNSSITTAPPADAD